MNVTHYMGWKSFFQLYCIEIKKVCEIRDGVAQQTFTWEDGVI